MEGGTTARSGKFLCDMVAVTMGDIILRKISFFIPAAAAFSATALLAILTACGSQVGGDVMATVDGRKSTN